VVQGNALGLTVPDKTASVYCTAVPGFIIPTLKAQLRPDNCLSYRVLFWASPIATCRPWVRPDSNIICADRWGVELHNRLLDKVLESQSTGHQRSIMSDFNIKDVDRRPSMLEVYPQVPGFDPPNDTSSPPRQLSSASSYADMNYLFGAQDPMLAQKPNRNRRKSTQGLESTKHRRTRSGCYTCRSRRVKVMLRSNH
jgi:hypothetical protein